MNMRNRRPGIGNQHGAALAVALIFLLIMTLIGVTAMRTTTLQEQMAGNFNDRNLALQGAEAGLRAAEDFIDGTASVAAFDGNNGLLDEDDADNEPDYFDSATWTGNSSRDCGVTLSDLAQSQPRCVIRYLGESTPSAGTQDLTIKGYGEGAASGNVSHFRITVRSVGGSDNAEVILRSRYRRIY